MAAAVAVAIAIEQPAVAADDDTKGAQARKKLVGTWKGAVVDGATGHKLTFTTKLIKGKKEDQDLGAGTFTLDLSKSPFHLDATRTEGGKKGQLYKGIYSLDGDTLKWCVSTPGNDRPTKFATEGSSFLLVLKRARN